MTSALSWPTRGAVPGSSTDTQVLRERLERIRAQVAEWRRVQKAATLEYWKAVEGEPGEWHVHNDSSAICHVEPSDPRTDHADAIFIAFSRSAMPALLTLAEGMIAEADSCLRDIEAHETAISVGRFSIVRRDRLDLACAIVARLEAVGLGGGA